MDAPPIITPAVCAIVTISGRIEKGCETKGKENKASTGAEGALSGIISRTGVTLSPWCSGRYCNHKPRLGV